MTDVTLSRRRFLEAAAAGLAAPALCSTAAAAADTRPVVYWTGVGGR